MRRRYISFIFIIAILGASAFLIAGKPAKKQTPACCKAAGKPCQPVTEPASPKTNLEHLSHQFITLPLFFY